MNVTRKELVEAFASSIGIEKAQEIIDEAGKALHFGIRQAYELEEGLEICEYLKKHGGIIKIAASCFRSTLTIKMRKKLTET